MSLYAIGDLHLHFQTDQYAQMQRRDPAWRNHTQKLQANCRALLKQEDTLLLLGDHSWGKNLSQCQLDLEFIQSLPGRKILLRGNHDMFWRAQQTEKLKALFQDRLLFLQGNFYSYEDYALVGTKGYCFEGPFYLDRRGKLLGWDEEAEKRSDKLIARELERLRASFEAARSAGWNKFIMLLHYPPTSILERQSAFTRLAEEYGAHQVLYAHIHGAHNFHSSIEGEFRSIEYHLVSGDYLHWMPYKVL